MKTLLSVILLSVLSQATFAKDYQVTGEVIEITDSKIVVDKKGEKFEIAKAATTKATGEVVKGAKVTVYYSMTASEIEAKPATAKKKK